MRRRSTLYQAKLQREIKGLSARLRRLMADRPEAHQLRSLSAKLNRKWAILGHGTRRQLLLNSCVVAALCICQQTAVAQTYAPMVLNPFGMVEPQTFNLYTPNCQLVDIDGDSDFDLFTADYNINSFRYQENIGTPQAPNFGPLQTDPFGLGNTSLGMDLGMQTMWPEFADLDGDMDQDILVLVQDTILWDQGNYLFIENTGSASAPAFGNEVMNPFGLGIVSLDWAAQPSLVDLDGDGDLDLMVSQVNDVTYHTEFWYHENTGTSTAPAFTAAVLDPFGIPTGGIEANGHGFVDHDCDGDLDLFLAGYDSIAYFQNVGTLTAPAFMSMPVIPGLIEPDLSATEYLTLADLDGDGDTDILIGDYDYGYYRYWEQLNGCTTVGIDGSESPNTDLVSVSPNPAEERIQVVLEPDHGFAELEITNVAGEVMERISVNGRASLYVDLERYSAGLYHGTLRGTRLQTFRFIKSQ